MNRVFTVLKTLRNHWKKSTFALCVVSYGINYGQNKIWANNLMRKYCEEAISYGNIPISQEEPKRITVILNPAAKKKKAKAQFEKYCAPLLHLAGMYVSIVQTDAEGQARGLMEVMGNTDSVAIAGGDGTLSEAVTGLLRRVDGFDVAAKLPIAILPLGRTNAVAESIFGHQAKEVKFLAEATMSLIRGSSKLVDVMKIEPIETDPETSVKPVYALAEIQWGAYRDTHTLRDKYWLWGPLRGYAAAVFCWLKKELSWDCEAELTYIAPCQGCQRCQGKYIKPPQSQIQQHSHGRWWHVFTPKTTQSAKTKSVDYNKIANPECGIQHTRHITTSDFSITTKNARSTESDIGSLQISQQQISELKISIGFLQEELTLTDFVSEMWQREKGRHPNFAELFAARELWFRPLEKAKKETKKVSNENNKLEDGKDNNLKEEKNQSERWLSIDQENFELRPMHITLLPESIRLFCPAEKAT